MSEFKSIIHRVRDAKAPSRSHHPKPTVFSLQDEDQADGGLRVKDRKQSQQERGEEQQQLDQAKITGIQQQS